jgi:hypothetical protein
MVQKTIMLFGKEVPFDDSQSSVEFVDTFTEDAYRDGLFYLGLGQIVVGTKGDEVSVKGRVNLRMTPAMLDMLIVAATSLRDKARRVQTPQTQTTKSKASAN